MLQDYLYWCQTPSILVMHKIRFFCHMALVLISIILLVETSVVLGYSIKMYYGTFLHSVPELMAGSSLSLILLGMAWLPSNELPGAYGLSFTRYVWQELVWSMVLSLGIFGGLFSLHESTPGLMTDCGRFFICRGYISIFVSAWICWFLISVPTVLLIISIMFQLFKLKLSKDAVLKSDISRFEYFWPSQSSFNAKPRINSIYPVELDFDQRLSRFSRVGVQQLYHQHRQSQFQRQSQFGDVQPHLDDVQIQDEEIMEDEKKLNHDEHSNHHPHHHLDDHHHQQQQQQHHQHHHQYDNRNDNHQKSAIY